MIFELSEKMNKFFNTPKGISRQARPVGTPWLGDCEACISVSLLSEVTRQTVFVGVRKALALQSC